jgi:transposase/regulator of replication initiation timing
MNFAELKEQVDLITPKLSAEGRGLVALFMPFCESLWNENQALRSESEALRKENTELKIENTELKSENTELKIEIKELKIELKELKDRLAKNSGNSSKPPSQDGYKSPAKRSMRAPTGKRPGGQKGHPGQGGKLKSDPDEIIKYSVDQCPDCHQSLKEQPVDELIRKQIEDIPPIKTIVTEYQIEVKTCPCCGQRWMAGGCPKEIIHEFQYGPRVKAISLYLSAYQFIPVKRAAEMLQIFGIQLSWGTLDNFRSSAAGKLDGFIDQLKQSIAQSEAGFFDETGIKVKGVIHWIHVASTKALSLFGLSTKRGVEAHKTMGVLDSFTGVAHHDGFRPYKEYKNATHSLCCAHLLRELKFAIDRDNQKQWAAPMIKLLVDIKHRVEKQDKKVLDVRWQGRYRKKYQQYIEQGSILNPAAPRSIDQKRGATAQSKTRNLLLRLRDYEDDVLRFMTHPAAEFDNNQAERDLRMNKVRAKVSGGFRSFKAGEEFMKIRSFIATAVKQGFCPIESLVQLCSTGNLEYLKMAKHPE